MIRIQGLTKNQMNEVERITSKLTKWEAYTRIEEQTIRSIVIDTLLEYRDIDNQDKLSHRNMQIKELKKFKALVEQILQMTNIHGVYKDDTDCVNSIREAIHRNINR